MLAILVRRNGEGLSAYPQAPSGLRKSSYERTFD